MVLDGWSECSLAESCKKPISYGIVQTGVHIPDGVPCVRVVDLSKRVLSTEKMITTSQEIHRSYRKTVLQEGELMMALRGEIGLVRIVDTTIEGANITRGIARLSPKDEIVNSDFLLWAMRSEQVRKNLLAKAGGSALQEISLTALRKLKLSLPPLPEQRKIAKILQTWDRAIATTEKLIDASKQQKKALMQQLLTGKKRFAGFEGEWDLKTVAEFGRVVTGSTPPRNVVGHYGGGFSWATAEDFKKKYVANTKTKLTPSGVKTVRVVPKGSVLVTCIASIGKNAIAGENLATNQQINSVVINKENYNEFFYYVICFSNSKLLSWAGTTAVPILNKSSFEKIPLPAPKIDEQQRVAQVLKSADCELDLLRTKLTNLKQEKKALMQQLLTGKRRVKIDD